MRERTPAYVTWYNMKNRCKGTTGIKDKKNYHDKGITYDIRWEKFDNFLEDMGERPEGKELDRIDGNKGYYKDNCRWVTRSINNLNKKVYNKKSGLPRRVQRANKKYRATIQYNGVIKHLGVFNTIEEAEQAYLTAYVAICGKLPPEYI